MSVRRNAALCAVPLLAVALGSCVSPMPGPGAAVAHMSLVPGALNANGSRQLVINITGMNTAMVRVAADSVTHAIGSDASPPYKFTVPAGTTHLYATADDGATAALDEWTWPIPASPCGRKSYAPVAGYNHVVVIVMENKTYSSVIGSPSAPYLTGLANQCATATNYAAASSPSRPNYIAMTSGGTQGCDGSNADPPSCQTTADNIFRQVLSSGGTVRSYAESMTSNCQYASSGLYATKHNPWPYYVGPNDQQWCQQYNIPLGSSTSGPLMNDIANGTLATFTYVSPDLCNDAHDCAVSVGDAWLQTVVGAVLAGPNYTAGDTAVIVTYDEYTPLPNVWIAPSVKAGTQYTGAMSHYGMLRTIEEFLRLPLLGAAATAPSMRDPFNI